jgi:hypothetical protein
MYYNMPPMLYADKPGSISGHPVFQYGAKPRCTQPRCTVLGILIRNLVSRMLKNLES